MEKQKVHTFSDESGTDGKSKFLALGLIKVDNVVNFHQTLEVIRQKHNFKNEIKFEKASSPRNSVAKEWIDEFFKFSSIKFYCLVIDKQKGKIPLMNLKQWPKFKLYTKLFLNRHLKGETVCFYFDSYGQVQDRKFEAYLLTHVANLEVIEGVNSKNYDVLQMCDLLLGSVRADFERTITSTHKKEIIEHLQIKLGVPKLAQSINKDNFSVSVLTEEKSFL